MYKLMIPFAVIMFGLFAACASAGDGDGFGDEHYPSSFGKTGDTDKALSLVNKNPATPLPDQENTGRVTSLKQGYQLGKEEEDKDHGRGGAFSGGGTEAHRQYVLIEELDCSGSPENIVIKNTMPNDEELVLSRWTIENTNKGTKFVFPDSVVVPGGASVNVISGDGVGTQSRTTFQWGTGQQWEDGDTATLKNAVRVKITEKDCGS